MLPNVSKAELANARRLCPGKEFRSSVSTMARVRQKWSLLCIDSAAQLFTGGPGTPTARDCSRPLLMRLSQMGSLLQSLVLVRSVMFTWDPSSCSIFAVCVKLINR